MSVAYTNNVLIGKSVIKNYDNPFDEAFLYTGSSDSDFFCRVNKDGFKIIWSSDALVYEHIPSSRLSLKWLALRGYRVGCNDIKTFRKFYSYPVMILHAFVLCILCFAAACFSLTIGNLGSRGLQFGIGVRRIFRGVGYICGLFGLSYDEYKVIHGK